MERVLLFQHPRSRYGVLASMTEAVHRALTRCQVHSVVCDWASLTDEALFELIRLEQPDCTFAINIFMDDSALYQPLGLPHVYLSVDALTYCHPALPIVPNIVALFVDRVSSDLFTELSERPGIWFPHAISVESIEQARQYSRPDYRPYDVTVLGSFIDEEAEKRSWKAVLTPTEIDDFCSIAEKALDDPSFAFLPATIQYVEGSSRIREALRSHGLTTYNMANSMERYLRGLDRERLLSAIQGQTVHIFTDDAGAWRSRPSSRGAVFHPSVPFDHVVRICCESRVVINSSPTIRAGLHERLLLAMAAGATVVTSAALPYPDWMEESGAVIPYTTSSLKSLTGRLASIQGWDTEVMRSWLLENHTWDVRLRTLLPRIDQQVHAVRESWMSNPFWKIATSANPG